MNRVAWLEQSEQYVNLALVTRGLRTTLDGVPGIELHFTSGETVFCTGEDAERVERRLKDMQAPRT